MYTLSFKSRIKADGKIKIEKGVQTKLRLAKLQS